jgi:hypothetical protein
MKGVRFLAFTGLLISIQLVSSGCGQGHQKYITYLNENDKSQLMQLTAAQPSLRSWWNNVPLEPSPEGQYIRGDKKMAGPYWLEGDSYVLGDPDGKTNVRFSIQADLSLRDENGSMWRRGPMTQEIVVLKKGLVSTLR